MNKNILPNTRGGRLLDFQQQKSHYAQALNPRKTMRISDDSYRKNYVSLHHNNKLEHESNRTINYENARIIKNLENIRNNQGILDSMKERAEEIAKNKKKPTLLNKFKEDEKKK